MVEEDQGVRVWRLAGATLPCTRFVLNGRKLTRKLQELRDSEGLQLVEGQENAFAALGELPGVRKVIRMHGGHHFFAVTLGKKPAVWRGWQERRSFRQADAVCAVSRFVAEKTRQLLKLGSRQIPILPNPVNTDQFSPRGEHCEEAGVIVFAGTLCRKKGVENLMQAFQLVKEQVPKARLVLAGRDQIEPGIGSFRAHIERRIDRQLKGSVEFLGPVNHDLLPDLYARAQVCVFPSYMESQGIVFVEAMAMGKALVAPKIPPVCEMIEDGEQALLCDPHDPESIASQLVRCLSDAELRHRLGQKGRKRAVERFSTQVLVRENIEFYRQVLAGERQ
jgi:glycosyltransferase involved in cell wall biosynthesis